MPVWIERAKGGCGGRVGRQAKQGNRRCTPIRPTFRLARRMDEPSKPAHRARRVDGPIITGAGDDRNWQRFRELAPILPLMELGNSIAAHQPDEFHAWIALLESADGVDRVAGPCADFEVGHADRSAAGHCLRRSITRFIGCHALCGFQRIAGRDEPPHLVEAKRADRGQADPPMPPMGRIERAPEKANALHG